MAYVTGVGLTAFGRHEGSSTLSLMTEAATAALADAGLERREVDGLVCGYPHAVRRGRVVGPCVPRGRRGAERCGLRGGVRQLHDHARDPARGDRPVAPGRVRAGRGRRPLRLGRPSFATTNTNPVDITAALLSNSRLFGDILPVIARDPGADRFLISVPVAGRGYDVPAFADGVVDVLIRFPPNVRGTLHRHTMDYITIVLQGELRFYRPDGALKGIRPTGSYTRVAANGEPHREGAGEQEAIVLFSIRGGTGPMFTLWEDDGAERILGFAEFKEALAAQIERGDYAKLRG